MRWSVSVTVGPKQIVSFLLLATAHTHIYVTLWCAWNPYSALHEERITHVFSNTDGINNPQGIQEDIAHKLLESDLTLQMGLLKDKLATEHMQEDSRAAFGMNPMSATMNLPVIDGMVDEESSEAIMICLTIAALALLPQIM